MCEDKLNITTNKSELNKNVTFSCTKYNVNVSDEDDISKFYNAYRKMPNPADFLRGLDVTQNFKKYESYKKVKQLTNIGNYLFYLMVFSLIIIILAFNISSGDYSKWLNCFEKDNKFSSVIVKSSQDSYLYDLETQEKIWENIYQKIFDLEKLSISLKNKLQVSLQKQKILKTKLQILTNETRNIFEKKLLEMSNKIDETFESYEADKIGQTDYALETSGGSVIATPETDPYPSNKIVNFFGIKMSSTSDPSTVIRPGALPGQCFAFRGKKGRIQIRLIRPILVTSVTIDYPHPKLIIDDSSAPKNFKVLGLKFGSNNITRTEIGNFVFQPGKKTTSNFITNSSENEVYEFVELEIVDNYGHPLYTCVYRVRIHGITIFNL